MDVEGKSSESPALLELVDVKDRTVTAARCTRSASRRRRSWSGRDSKMLKRLPVDGRGSHFEPAGRANSKKG